MCGSLLWCLTAWSRRSTSTIVEKPGSTMRRTAVNGARGLFNDARDDYEIRLPPSPGAPGDTGTDGTVVSGTVIGGTVTSGTVTVGTVTCGTVLGGAVTWGTVICGTVASGTMTGGTVTWGTVTGGTVTWGTAIGGTVTWGTLTPATEPVGGVGRAAGEPGNGSAVADCSGVRPPRVGTVGGGRSSLGPPSTIDRSPGSVRGPPGCVACVFCSTVAGTLPMPVAAWE